MNHPTAHSAIPIALPEIDVASAPPEIATAYADIARLAGIPLPALIWRHLATYPTALPEAWTALRPLYATGLVQETAWRTVEVSLAGAACGPDEQRLRTAGLGHDAIAAYRRVLRSYNRSNPVNYVGVRILLACLARPASSGAAPPQPALDWQPPDPVGVLVPMIKVEEIPPTLRAMIDAIAADPDIDRSRIVPSLYRHLVPWPGLLQMLHDDLTPRIRSGEMMARVTQVSAALQTEADRLAPCIGALPALAAIGGIGSVLENFSHLIPEMIVVGTMLEQGLSSGSKLGL